MKTTNTTYSVSRNLGSSLSPVATVEARDAADAVRVALDLSRRPRLDNNGPHGSGYLVTGDRFRAWYVATPA